MLAQGFMNSVHDNVTLFKQRGPFNTKMVSKGAQYISCRIFQKVPAEIVQKSLILSQKRLVSNRRNFGLLAPKSMRFPSKTENCKIFLFNCRNFYERLFPFSQNAFEFVL